MRVIVEGLPEHSVRKHLAAVARTRLGGDENLKCRENLDPGISVLIKVREDND